MSHVAILCGAVQASARCENLIGVMVFNVRISFFENARPHRVARTRSCSLSPTFSVLNFYSYAFFLQKSLLLLFVISVIVVGVFDHSAVQTAVVVVF